MLPHRDIRLDRYHLLVVEKEPGLYRLYVGNDRHRFCHYDTGSFQDLKEATEAARSGFNPTVFEILPFTPYTREEVLQRAPYAFESIRPHPKEDKPR